MELWSAEMRVLAGYHDELITQSCASGLRKSSLDIPLPVFSILLLKPPLHFSLSK